MSTEHATVNSIFREYSEEFCKTYKVSDYTKKVIRAITICRTEELGGHIHKCDSCGDEITLYNSCRNRHCPQCQFMKKEKWIADRKNEILPFQYFHIVFTIPEELNPIVLRNKKVIYKLLFDSTRETLLSVSNDEKYFGAKIGFYSILHTWGQKLNLHPHIHTVVPGGGYNPENKKWIRANQDYLVPVKVLQKKFRSIFLVELKNIYKQNELDLLNTIYERVGSFQSLIDKLFSKDWIVYIKESFKNSDSVIDYLSKYTHRIAISNHRILSCENGIVRFSYKDYKDENKRKIIEMPVMRFMKYFLLHIVPKRFVRIRHYGLLSNSTKKKNISKCREYFDVKEKTNIEIKWHQIFKSVTGHDVSKCKKCSTGNMIVVSSLEPICHRSGP